MEEQGQYLYIIGVGSADDWKAGAVASTTLKPGTARRLYRCSVHPRRARLIYKLTLVSCKPMWIRLKTCPRHT
jgi:hypothetical protein